VIFESNKNLFAIYLLRFNSFRYVFREISLCTWRATLCLCISLFRQKRRDLMPTPLEWEGCEAISKHRIPPTL